MTKEQEDLQIMSDLELGLGLKTGRRSYEEVLKQRQDEGYKTATTNEQARVEEIVLKFYRSCREGDPVLLRPKHIQFLKKAITNLNDTYECLDSSRPWLCFWILHSLAILGEQLESEECSKIAGFLAKCQSSTGGFGGGPGQYPHLASTYASVNALCTIGTQEAYDVIDRIFALIHTFGSFVSCAFLFFEILRPPGQMPIFSIAKKSLASREQVLCIVGLNLCVFFNWHNSEVHLWDTNDPTKNLKRFLASLRGEDGSFSMHENGEVDIRGAYCALAAAKLTNVYTPDMFRGTAEWIAKCQTWEGGFGGCPGMEAHGGYAYCALAALIMLGKTELCHLPELLRWIVNKQMRLEGGFQGRTNKLVDGCYSFWQGGTFPLIAAILSTQGKGFNNSDHWLFNQEALQEYILTCCQNPHGGLLDKPGKNRDIYHTCYVLSGLSIAQNSPIKSIIGRRLTNKVEVIHPVYNVEYSAAKKAQEYFPTLPIPAD